ncbi:MULTISPECIES: 5'-methylthioadenosine/S-adenosylhomocysteine nucleosidase [unclassified Mesorhizobium]|uniref:5'-methylthioadenosine/S-adenosylhomocysteine nucleosidase n=1 Tax=unclassified Mesorhizobium TaxID=325217 RepID=UPI000FCABFE9|nr:MULTISPECIES: 5'-methylthioadenosine/S-adenosylhomocysteine nucleosidase [unclassified Mesorhizobium]RUZ81807.1 5'-methylthioadenosine/S-adenosylhomocysteine nucleosidase [Mesorhizobium sp. M7A.F.Ca.US.003.02.2.1]RUY92598.1 5'-methylthioadenosine/S-adenosylhomocysteine nucleosidase [Mesorhizobium sp. M7A.F.Ca.CA.001.12.2.1]RUZ26883.1 5'-methylthioadenosine/S-adenosylhomocysteine nucleosidase [Mesorhizobium sp. M7A.F.Ca.US.007.01.2.1]RUZ46617.1 5'-methylthioadenosine/S-adenosylhomocysteine nu
MTDKIRRLSGKDVLFVMAAQAEYGPHLKQLFTPLMTGVGPVEAGVRLGAELSWLKSQKTLPDLVVSLGSAGSRTLEQTGIYQAVSVSYRDIDASPLGFEKGATPFLDLPVTVPLPFKIPDIKQATLSTGGAIITGAAYDAVNADMVDMETFACLRACQLFDIPLIGLRGISDGAADLRHVGDWTEYLEVIDEKLAEAVMRLEQAIGLGTLLKDSPHEDARPL